VNEDVGAELPLSAFEGAEIHLNAFVALLDCLRTPDLAAATKRLKPSWWNEKDLLVISAAVVGVLPNNPDAWGMRAQVLSGIGAESWGGSSTCSGTFSAAHMREAAKVFQNQAALDPSKKVRCLEAAHGLMCFAALSP